MEMVVPESVQVPTRCPVSDSEPRFWFVRPGLLLPEAAVLAALAVERAGHRLVLDGDDVLIERGPGCPPIAPELVEAARRWKHHVWLLTYRLTRDVAPVENAPKPESEAHRA